MSARASPLDRPDELLGRAERAVERARSRGITEAECYIEWGEDLEVEIEKGALASTGASQGGGGALRVVVDGRLGFAYFTADRDVPAALEQAVRMSRHAERLGFRFPRAGKAGKLAGRWDADVAALQVDDAIALADGVLAGARETAPKATLSGGGASLDAQAVAIASTEGVAAHDRSTGVSAAASLVQPDRGRSVSASASAAAHGLTVDAQAVGAEAGRTLVSLLRPKKAVGGKAEVLFRPEAAAELVTDLVISACVGDEALRGKTVWSGKLGTRVASPQLDVTDDPRARGAIGGSPFDDEGMPTRRLPILERGTLRTYLFDAWDAHRHKVRGTRSAVRGDFKARPSTGTHHVTVSSARARPLDRLLASMDAGYLVDSVLGAHTANATTGDFSVTAPNVFRVEGGEVVGPVREVAMGGNLPALLGQLRGVSKEAKAMEGLRMPWLLFGGVDVSV